MAELVCPQHGPYDASFGSCPYCAGGSKRPQAPRPLGDDGMPTNLGAPQPPTINTPRAPAGRPLDDMSTDIGGGGRPYGGGGRPYGGDDDLPTELPGRRPGRGILDPDSEEETQLGRRGGPSMDDTQLEFEPTGLLGLLWVKEGDRRGKIYHVRNGDIVGRGDASVMLDDPKVSSQHAKFTVEGEQFILWDFGSTNGTYVNGERIRAATPLNENDLIKMGNTIFILKVLV